MFSLVFLERDWRKKQFLYSMARRTAPVYFLTMDQLDAQMQDQAIAESNKNLCNLKEELIIIEREIVRLRKLRKTEEEKDQHIDEPER